jgi:hypothetical protein
MPSVTAVSLAAEAIPASVTPNGQSSDPVVNANGRYTVFQSNAIDLVPGQATTNVTTNIFVYDNVAHTTALVSHSSLGSNVTANGTSTNPVVSADGRFIAYQSTATDLQGGIIDQGRLDNNDVFLYDRTTGVNTLVSRNSVGGATISTADGPSFNPKISADGRFIAFSSQADNLASGGEVAVNGLPNIYVYNSVTGSNDLVSRSSTTSAGGPAITGKDTSGAPAISADGNFIAYQSNATDLVNGQASTAGTSNVFLYNRLAKVNFLVSHNSANLVQGSNGSSGNPTISSAGSFVAFQSSGTDLISGGAASSSPSNVFLFNLTDFSNTLVSHNSASGGALLPADGASSEPVISGNGQFIAYSSLADDLVTNQKVVVPGAPNVYLYSSVSGTNTLVSHHLDQPNVTCNGAATMAGLSADGGTVVFMTNATDLVSGQTELDTGGDVFVFGRMNGNTRLVSSAQTFNNFTGNGLSDQPTVSSDGTFIAFRSSASNLVTGDLNSQPDVFGFVNRVDDLIGQNPVTGQVLVSVSSGSSFQPQTIWTTFDPTVQFTDFLVGDFNGDGHDDIAARVVTTGTWYVCLSTGTAGFLAPTIWDQWVAGGSSVWADVQVGDFDGKGRAEIAGRYRATGQWWVDTSTGSAFVATPWTVWNPKVTWVNVMNADLTGSGQDDLVGRVKETGEWWAGLSTGTSFINNLWTKWTTTVTWVDVHVGDFNGDGRADIVGRTLETGQWWVGLSSGFGFTNHLWAIWSTLVTWNVFVGDFNGDGKADIAGRVLENGTWWVGLSNGTQFNTSLWTTWVQAPGITWVDVQVGDFNGDGFTDIVGRIQQTGDWFVGTSNGASLFTVTKWTTWSPNVAWTNVSNGAFV